MKMRVMVYTKNGQMKTYADAIGQAIGCLVSDIPPAYPCENERLVVIGLSCKGKLEDIVERFCVQLTPQRANNVAFFIDGKPGTEAETKAKEIIKNAGINVLDEDTYYIKCGMFGKSITIENRQKIVDWIRGLEEKLTQK